MEILKYFNTTQKNKKIIISQFLVSFILMFLLYYFMDETYGVNIGFSVLFTTGLLFGPFGVIGSALGCFACELWYGYSLFFSIISLLISIIVSYLPYKLWYVLYDDVLTKPRLNNIYNISKFLILILLSSIIYGVLLGSLISVTPDKNEFLDYMNNNFIMNYSLFMLRYILSFLSFSFIIGNFGIYLSNKYNLLNIPKTSEKTYNKKHYNYLVIITSILILFIIILRLIHKFYYNLSSYNIVLGVLLLTSIILLIGIIRIPITSRISKIRYETSITEQIMNKFLLMSSFILLIGIIEISYHIYYVSYIDFMTDVIILFFIPVFIILHYVEKNVLKPIMSFSQVRNLIKENKKVDINSVLKIYSKYRSNPDEIGELSRSSLKLIKYNNEYIENIRSIEGEKERMKAELDIATRIQQSILPTTAIDNSSYIIYGHSKPAKEVGGDFFDYYEIDDDNLMIVIGDASGKGVPAALFSVTTQASIKQIIKFELDPSKILSSINNILCENNSEYMFITLWLGIYNKKTGILRYSNGGHNPPLIKNYEEFSELDLDSGIVLGIMEDMDFVCEEVLLEDELLLYTDGVTEAINNNKEEYGIERLKDYLNKNNQQVTSIESTKSVVDGLFNNIKEFSNDIEQFDDITIVYLKLK